MMQTPRRWETNRSPTVQFESDPLATHGEKGGVYILDEPTTGLGT